MLSGCFQVKFSWQLGTFASKRPVWLSNESCLWKFFTLLCLCILFQLASALCLPANAFSKNNSLVLSLHLTHSFCFSFSFVSSPTGGSCLLHFWRNRVHAQTPVKLRPPIPRFEVRQLDGCQGYTLRNTIRMSLCLAITLCLPSFLLDWRTASLLVISFRIQRAIGGRLFFSKDYEIDSSQHYWMILWGIFNLDKMNNLVSLSKSCFFFFLFFATQGREIGPLIALYSKMHLDEKRRAEEALGIFRADASAGAY